VVSNRSRLLIMLAAWLFYHLRIRQVSRQLTIRMEERLGERTRIAQELHDTVCRAWSAHRCSLKSQTARSPEMRLRNH